MLHVVICDDNTVICDDLAKRVTDHYANTAWAEGLQIDIYNDLATLCARQAAPDILLLDINFCPDEPDAKAPTADQGPDGPNAEAPAADQGPDDEGLRAGLLLTRRWPDMQLIFISSMQQYISDGYKYNGRDFIKKWDLDAELNKTLERITPEVQRLKNLRAGKVDDAPPPHMLTFPLDGRRALRVDLYDIVYIEKIKKSRNLKLVLARPYHDSLVHVIPATLAEVRAQLQQLPEILEVSKGTILNLYQAEKVESDYFLMKNNDKIFFNRRKHLFMWDKLYDYKDLMERRMRE